MTIRPLVLGLALTAALLAPPTATPAASAHAPAAPAALSALSGAACAASWGSLAKGAPHSTTKQVTDVRAGRHRCFDRLVVTLNGDGTGRAGYHVRYVRRVVRDGSGTVVHLRGGAFLQVVLNARAYDDAGDATYRPADRRELADVTGYDTFRQVAWAGSFEGQTMIGLGVRARLPMRVFVLADDGGGRRLVVDVAHRWP